MYVKNKVAGFQKSEKGAFVTRPFEVSRKICYHLLVQKFLLNIKRKWSSREKEMRIIIQAENERLNCPVDHLDAVKAGQSEGFGISIIWQPPNSLKYNVLDLELLNDIGSLQDQFPWKTIDELITAVQCSWKDIELEALKMVSHVYKKQ